MPLRNDPHGPMGTYDDRPVSRKDAAKAAQRAADIARRTRENAYSEAAGILARLHQFARVDADVRDLLTIAELKQLGAAEDALRAILERLSQ